MTREEIDKILLAKNTKQDESMFLELNEKLKVAKDNNEVCSLFLEYIPKIYSYV
tara:strand:+ start:394 stop:555 length:162 start_codon:yes stop_codon:yes gene_type:complete